LEYKSLSFMMWLSRGPMAPIKLLRCSSATNAACAATSENPRGG